MSFLFLPGFVIQIQMHLFHQNDLKTQPCTYRWAYFHFLHHCHLLSSYHVLSGRKIKLLVHSSYSKLLACCLLWFSTLCSLPLMSCHRDTSLELIFSSTAMTLQNRKQGRVIQLVWLIKLHYWCH